MARLSIATDLGMGQPMEYAMTTSIVAVRLGEAAGLSDAELRDAYYEALLRHAIKLQLTVASVPSLLFPSRSGQ